MRGSHRLTPGGRSKVAGIDVPILGGGVRVAPRELVIGGDVDGASLAGVFARHQVL